MCFNVKVGDGYVLYRSRVRKSVHRASLVSNKSLLGDFCVTSSRRGSVGHFRPGLEKLLSIFLSFCEKKIQKVYCPCKGRVLFLRRSQLGQTEAKTSVLSLSASQFSGSRQPPSLLNFVQGGVSTSVEHERKQKLICRLSNSIQA